MIIETQDLPRQMLQRANEEITQLRAENSRLTIDNAISNALIEKLCDTNDVRGKALAAQCTETKKLRAELAEAQNLAASRLEQITSDRRQYLDVKQQRDDLLAALECIVPYIPKSSAADGGAVRYSAAVAAADVVRTAIAKVKEQK